MHPLVAPYIYTKEIPNLQHVSASLDLEKKHALSHHLWTDVINKPSVKFSIAHNGKNIFLKYYVHEKYIRAVETEINGKVWEDSCVEFFISFDDGATYYNIEFNYIGTGLVSFGHSRDNREPLVKAMVASIETLTAMRSDKGWKSWEMTLVIPISIFVHHNMDTLKGAVCKANFYKCGDLLPEPHYLAWKNIDAAQPDFHLPAFFAPLQFES